jgi:hypothetical protein
VTALADLIAQSPSLAIIPWNKIRANNPKAPAISGWLA